MNTNKFDYIVIGCGLAGLFAALHASRNGTVALITKSTIELSNSYWAQGGIAAALSNDDSVELHASDTINAGKGISSRKATEVLVSEGKEIVNQLIEMGMPFDEEDGKISLGMEGGHAKRRVLHAGGDATGKEIVNFILKLLDHNKNIKIFEKTLLHKIIVENEECLGVNVFDLVKNKLFGIFSSSTILASGGGSAIYSRSTNPKTSLGDGIILAYNAGAEIESMEFVQFHPTSFYSKTGKTFLISEAVRGEGAYLVNYKDERFLSEQKINELSPRDEVSAAIYNEMKTSGKTNVFLKLNHLDPEKIKTRFNSIYKEALQYGIDITISPIPVAPAAHYMIGGIKTGINAETNIARLYAVGEVASSGIHGANRLASNSLLECLVFSKRAVEHMQNNFTESTMLTATDQTFEVNKNNESLFTRAVDYISTLMWNNVGILRSKETLELMLLELRNYGSSLKLNNNEYYLSKVNSLILLSYLITNAALVREESRGCHLRSDYPAADSTFISTIVQKKNNNLKFAPIEFS